MKESRSHLVVLGMVAAVVAAVFYVGYTTPIRLGLDLQGGLEIVLKANPKKGQELTQEQLTQSVAIIRDRVDRLGVAEPEIRTQGRDQIAVELPGEKDADRAVEVVGSTAQLRFYDFQENLVGGKAYRNGYELLSRNQKRAKETLEKAQARLEAAEEKLAEADTAAEREAARKAVKKAQFDEQYYLFQSKPPHKELAGPAPSREKLLEEFDGKVPKDAEVLLVPIGEVLLHGQPDRIPVTVDQKGRFDRSQGVYLLLKDNPALTGDKIRSATAETQQGGWATGIIFTREGGRQFGEVTEEIARAGALNGVEQSFAIVLDDEIVSAPSIDYKQYPSGIKGTQAQVTGLDDREEAENLALVLNTGALPVEFEIISKTQVSATLGEQSLRQGLVAGAAGLLVVMVYLIVFYRFLGVVADIALLIYAFIFYGLIVGIPITMTLPGIAGMILTIGVAADANIIIFERIREEYRAGRSVRAAVSAGYSKGLKTIIDANAVTLITALVLFVLGVGSVRGFALLLGVGTILSMFTAVAATYAMLGLLGRSPIFRSPAVIGGTRKPLRFHARWMNYRRHMFVFVAGVMLVSALLVGVRGLNLGVDFKSGTKFDVNLAQANVKTEDVRGVLAGVDQRYANATIQETREPLAPGQKAPTDPGTSFSIRVESLATQGGEGETARERSNDSQVEAERDVREALEDRFGLRGTEGESAFNVQTIGPSFGRQIIQGALLAIVVSLFLTVCYIGMRFEWKFAIPVLVAITHDLLVSAGAYALTGREFTSATVAALLTILGYSLYDTIIVFDRIRENVGVLRKSSYTRIVDTSINEVLTRSINTTLVVLLPIGALFFFGGETLKDFAYALLVGIFAGTYSSIIVASPILSWIKEREPAWARRASVDGRRPGGGNAASNGVAQATGSGAAGGNGAVPLEQVPGDESLPATTPASPTATTPTSAAAATDGSEQARRDRRTRAQRKKR